MFRWVIFLSLVFSFSFATSSAQEKGTITILDQVTGEALPFANICFESLDKSIKLFSTSGVDGKLINQATKPSLVAVSFVGFSTVLDTINPGESRIISLIPSLSSMEEVVVTGQFQPIRSDRSIYRVEVIGSQKIEAQAANNLGDLLKNELSFRTSQDGALGTGISLQGLTGEHVKILIDGVPVIGRQNGILDLSQINLQNVDHVEIVQGPMSVIYGSNALAGAINIITRKNTREKLVLNAEAYYESVGVYNFNSSGGIRRKNHMLNFSTARNFFGGYSVTDLGRWQQWKPKLQYNSELDWNWSLSDIRLRFNSSWFSEELRDKGVLDPAFRFEKAFDKYHYTKRITNRLDGDYYFRDSSSGSFTAAYSIYNKRKKTTINDLVNLRETLAAPSLQDTTKFSNWMWRSAYNSNFNNWINFQAGIDLNYEEATGKRIRGGKSIGDYAAFLSGRFELPVNIAFQPGLRVIHNTRYKAPLVYSGNVLWNPSSSGTFRFSAGRGFRAPSLKELYLDFHDTNHDISGNDSLIAESSWNFNLTSESSAQFGKNNVKLVLSLFHNRILNKIDLILDEEKLTWAKYYNIKEGLYKTQGGEARLQYGFHPRFKTTAGLVLTGRSKLSNLNSYYYTCDYTLDLNYHNLKYGFILSAFYKYSDKYISNRGSFDKDFNLIDVREDYVDSYQFVDLSLSKAFLNQALNINVGVKNLLDVKNILATGNGSSVHGGAGSGEMPVAWGRTYFMKINWTFRVWQQK